MTVTVWKQTCGTHCVSAWRWEVNTSTIAEESTRTQNISIWTNQYSALQNQTLHQRRLVAPFDIFHAPVTHSSYCQQWHLYRCCSGRRVWLFKRCRGWHRAEFICHLVRQVKNQEEQSGKHLHVKVRQIASAPNGICNAAFAACSNRCGSCLFSPLSSQT